MSWWEQYEVADTTTTTTAPKTASWLDQYEPVKKPDPPTYTRRGRRAGSTLGERLSYELGQPVLTVSDLSIFERGDIGLSDTLAERQLKFKQKIAPEGEYRSVKDPYSNREFDVYRRSPNDPWRMRDEPGVTLGDLADAPAELATLAAQGGVAAFGPPGLMAQLGIQAGLAGLAHLGKEGLEEARGYQLQSGGQVAADTALQAGGDLVAGALPAGVARALRGPGAEVSQTIFNDFTAMRNLRDLIQRDTGQDVLRPMAHQLSPNNLILGRLAAQASSTSPAMKTVMTQQQMEFGDLINATLSDVPGQVGRTLTAAGGKAFRRQKNELMRDFQLNNEQAGNAIRGIFDATNPDGFYRKSRQQINQAYDEAGQLAEGTRFDLEPAKQAAKEVTQPVEATVTTGTPSAENVVDIFSGRPVTGTEVREFVNVAQSPGEKVNRVASLLNQIDSEQANWEVVKELRSQVGDVIARNPKDENIQSGAAKYIYRALSDVMDNPIDANPKFVKAWRKANDLSRKRFEVYEQGRVQQALANDSPSEVSKMFNSPDNLTPVIREVVDQYDPSKRALIKKNIQSSILESSDPIATIRKWESVSSGNRQAYDWLFANKSERAKFLHTAEKMEALRQSPLAQMLESSTRQIDRGNVLLDRVGPAELETTMRQLGGKGSDAVESMRMAAIDRILNRVMKFTDDGLPTVDKGTLAKAIKETKDQGIWEKLFTKDDRIRLRGMDAYARRVFKSLKDTGTSLEQAQAVAALKHPSTFLQGFHALFANNRVLAPLLMSKRLGKIFEPKQPRRGPSRKDAWFIFGGQFASELAQLANESVSETAGQ